MKPTITLIKNELFRQGGLEKYTWQIAKDFCSLNVPITILTSGTLQPSFSHPLLQIVSLPVRHRLSYLSVLHFDTACHEYLTKHSSPIVFGLDRNRFQTHLRAGNGVHAAYLQQRAKEEGLAKKLSFSLNPLHQTILSLEKKAFEHPQLRVLFANSHMVKQEILSHYKTPPHKIQVIHNGVEWSGMQTPFHSWVVQRENILHQLHLDKTAFQFLFIGHNFHRKGLEPLLHALSFMKREHFQLSVVGKDKNLPFFTSLVRRLQLSNKVFFFGQQEQTLPFYQMADSLVIPSIYDPFANVTVEALAMGLFTISSRYNGGHEVLTPHNGAVIHDLYDPAAFAHTLTQAISHPKTPESAAQIRQSVQHLDFSSQLRLITQTTLDSVQSLSNRPERPAADLLTNALD